MGNYGIITILEPFYPRCLHTLSCRLQQPSIMFHGNVGGEAKFRSAHIIYPQMDKWPPGDRGKSIRRAELEDQRNR